MICKGFSPFLFPSHHPQAHGEPRLFTVADFPYSEDEDAFYNAHYETAPSTPMQHQLMQMFFPFHHHQLSKSEICDALWPKKDDPSETLFTLIAASETSHRNSNLKIEVDRGRAYRLTDG